jgi:hypothetical protein
VTAVKIERLQDISADDCLAECIPPIANEDAKRVWSTALRGEKAPTIDQCCNRESLAERWVGLRDQLGVWHRIARSEEILNHPYVTGAS